MHLSGWDTISVVSIARVNAALAKRACELLGGFDFKADTLRIKGVFEPWRVVRGGSGQLLRLETPISELMVEGVPGKGIQKFEKALVTVEVALKLIPEAAHGGHALVFDFSEESDSEVGGGTIRPIGVEVEGVDLDPVTERLLPDAVARCLSAHAEDITYVFAETATTGAAGWLAPVEVEWGYIETPDTAHLALFGLLKPRPSDGLARSVEPPMLAAEAAFAVSGVRWSESVLAPTMSHALKVPFICDAQGRVSNKKRFAVPGGKKHDATVGKMLLQIRGNKLHSHTTGDAYGPLGMHLKYSIDAASPFTFDKRTGATGFAADNNPKVSHSGGLSGKFAWLIDWLFQLILAFQKDTTNKLISQIAVQNQKIAANVTNAVGWTGSQAFKATNAQLADAMALFDNHSAN